MNKYQEWTSDAINTLIYWHDPWWWISLSLCCFFISILGIWPLLTHPEFSQAQIIALVFRRITLFTFGALISTLLLTLFIIDVGGSKFHFVVAQGNGFLWFAEMIRTYWTFPVLGIFLGTVGVIVIRRYLHPVVSSWWRRFRVVQSGDTESDIRREITSYATVDFEPSTYYRDDQMFFGLDADDEPIYVPWEIFSTSHGQIIGPTQEGKGVLLGVLLDQLIRRGSLAFYIDPKHDKHIPSIMAAACDATGRKFIYLDLNPDGPGSWAPFKCGSARDGRDRLISVFGLESRGTDADVYLGAERGVADELSLNTSRAIGDMLAYIRKHDLSDRAKRLEEGLKEWQRVSTFTPKSGRGFDMMRTLESDAVIYVRGSITDTVIKDATKAFITELVGQLTNPDLNRKRHVFTGIDEARFVISTALVDALATVGDSNANIFTAYQSTLDLRNLSDRSTDGRSAEHSVNTNSHIKVIYRAADPETAEYFEQFSGTQQKTVARFEGTSIDNWGGEVWNDSRMMNAVAEGIIPMNLLLALQKRVSILYRPGHLAQVLRTCWVPFTTKYDPKTKRTQPITPKHPKPDEPALSDNQSATPRTGRVLQPEELD